MKKLSLTSQIAIALVLAIIVGILLRDYADFVNEYIKPLGSIFLNMLKFIVVPLVLFSIMAGILSMDDVSKVGKLGLRALLYFMFTTVIAVTLGLVLSTMVKGFLPLIHVETGSSAPEIEVPDITIREACRPSGFSRGCTQPCCLPSPATRLSPPCPTRWNVLRRWVSARI